MAQQIQRWIEVTPSQFTHETEGLNVVRALLPDQSPFRAWSNKVGNSWRFRRADLEQWISQQSRGTNTNREDD